MDQRQAQIRERAGLEESRINEDFAEFLKKFGPWILGIAVVLGGGSAARRYWATYQENKVNDAFEQLEAARAGGDAASPDTLLSVAEEFSSVGAVNIIARMDAADAYLNAIRRGVKLGSTVEGEGTVANADDVLTADDRAAYAGKARAQYQTVADATASDTSKKLWHLNALFGLAAIAETERNFDVAGPIYQKIQAMTADTAYAMLGDVAKKRAESLTALAALPALLAKADLPDLAPAPAPPTPPAIPGDVSDPASAPFTIPTEGAGVDLGGGTTPVTPSTTPSVSPSPAVAPTPADGTAPAPAPAPPGDKPAEPPAQPKR
jgi:hypothetical protein